MKTKSGPEIECITIGSLFSGIGGLELGLERALDARTVWQVEADQFCRRVLARHWPTTERFDDVKTARSLPAVDVMCGGFPCQDVSVAGKGAGIDGERSGLWREFARIISESRPLVVVIENVAALAGRGLSRVLQDLADRGYVGSWNVVSAASVGAPHRRDRIFIAAADTDRCVVWDRAEWHARWCDALQATRESLSRHARENGSLTDAASAGLEIRHGPEAARSTQRLFAGGRESWCGWVSPSPVRGVDDGIPGGMDRPRRRRPAADRHRLKALGNAVVPQCSMVAGHVVGALLRSAVEDDDDERAGDNTNKGDGDGE